MKFACVLVGLIGLASCGRTASDSQLAYGFHSFHAAKLINLPNHSEIRVCNAGKYRNLLQWAADTWGRPIGYTYYVTESCYRPHFSIDTTECDDPARTGFAEIGRIVICEDRVSEARIPNLILHEMGHMFGLCDQYHAGLGNCEVTSVNNEQSIMGYNSENTVLTPDDEMGIQRLKSYYDSYKIHGRRDLTLVSKRQVYCKFPKYDANKYYGIGALNFRVGAGIVVSFSYQLDGWPDPWSYKHELQNDSLRPDQLNKVIDRAEFDDSEIVELLNSTIAPLTVKDGHWQISHCFVQ